MHLYWFMAWIYRRLYDRDDINKKKQQLRWSHGEHFEINYLEAYSEGFSKQIPTETFSKYIIQSKLIQ